MLPDAIRAITSSFEEPAALGAGTTPYLQRDLFYILRELTAQIAELNTNLIALLPPPSAPAPQP